MQLTWVKRAGETLCLLNHTTYHTQEENNTFFYFVPLTITRACYCEGDTSTIKNLIQDSNNSTPYQLWHLSTSWGCTLNVYHSAWSIHMQHSKLLLRSKRQLLQRKDKYPTCTLYLVILWLSKTTQSILWNAFNIVLSHCMVPMWNYDVPKEVLHNSRVTQILQTASYMNIMSHIE